MSNKEIKHFNCVYCKKETAQIKDSYDRSVRHFCSRQCSLRFRYANSLSELHPLLEKSITASSSVNRHLLAPVRLNLDSLTNSIDENWEFSPYYSLWTEVIKQAYKDSDLNFFNSERFMYICDLLNLDVASIRIGISQLSKESKL